MSRLRCQDIKSLAKVFGFLFLQPGRDFGVDGDKFAIGESQGLLPLAGVADKLASGEADPGVVLANAASLARSTAAFIAALGKHRHPAREKRLPRP